MSVTVLANLVLGSFGIRSLGTSGPVPEKCSGARARARCRGRRSFGQRLPVDIQLGSPRIGPTLPGSSRTPRPSPPFSFTTALALALRPCSILEQSIVIFCTDTIARSNENIV